MTRKGAYGVKVIRGPVLDLPPHPDAAHLADFEDLLTLKSDFDRPLAVDLFCGAGGLSLGLDNAGFNVVLGVDHDETAVATHRAHFGGLSLTRDLSAPDSVRELATALKRLEVDLIAGGPPCQPFSRAGRSKIRSLVQLGARPAHDERRDLWHSFIEIVEVSQPTAVLIENVPDMALSDDMLVLRRIHSELAKLGYDVNARLVDAWRYGVPQHRQRLIIVGVANGRRFDWPIEQDGRVTVSQAIGDLPEVEGGYRHPEGTDGRHRYRPGGISNFQRRVRSWPDGELSREVYDHITRPVRDDDRRAFEQMDATTTYADLGEDVKRYRDDIFVDKYKRLGRDELSRTITAHIARDGYWYIHPTQPRTLTVREAARIQTFPDRYRFAGPPSAAFRQIGNAVPPLLAEVVGRQLRAALDGPVRHKRPPAEGLAPELVEWWEEQPDLSRPWLRDLHDPARMLIAEVLLDRVPHHRAAVATTALKSLAVPPEANNWMPAVKEVAINAGREDRFDVVADLIAELASGDVPRTAQAAAELPGVTTAMAGNVSLAAFDEDPIIASLPCVRVAGRYFGLDVSRSRYSHGRMAIAEIVGGDELASQAHLALNELGALVCRPTKPVCDTCPLAPGCAYRRGWRPGFS